MNDIPELTKKLGIQYDESNTIELVPSAPGSNTFVTSTQQTTNLPAVVTPANRVQDEEIEYQLARELRQELAKTGMKALKDMARLAQMTGEARAFEVVGSLIKSLNETEKNMREAHQEKPNQPHMTVQGGTNIQQAVFLGSQSELLKEIDANTRTNTIDITPEPESSDT